MEKLQAENYQKTIGIGYGWPYRPTNFLDTVTKDINIKDLYYEHEQIRNKISAELQKVIDNPEYDIVLRVEDGIGRVDYLHKEIDRLLDIRYQIVKESVTKKYIYEIRPSIVLAENEAKKKKTIWTIALISAGVILLIGINKK